MAGVRAVTLAEGPETTYAVVMDEGDEVVDSLTAWAGGLGLSAARLSAIGALSEATLGYFDWETRGYRRIAVPDQVEVVSLLGDLARGPDGETVVHAHAVLGRPDGSVRGGHLLAGRVRPTLEVVVVESPAHLRRRDDTTSGLALIDLATSDPSGGR